MVPKLRPPTVDFARSSISLIVFGPVLELLTSTIGMSISLATGMISRIGSNS